jgi:hypothetical protein
MAARGHAHPSARFTWDMLILGCGDWTYWPYVRWLRAGEGMSSGADAAVSGTA